MGNRKWLVGTIGWALLLGVLRADAAIVINEVLADPAALTGDANGDGVVNSGDDEFVELVNAGFDPVSLDSWMLSDLVKVRHTFSPGTSIPASGFYVVFGGGIPQGFSTAAIASTNTLGLNNSGDTLTLLDGNGLLIDSLTYGSEGGQDVSLTRSPDAAGVFTSHATVNGLPFSPGTTIDGLEQLFASSPPDEPLPDDPNLSEPLPDHGGNSVVPEPSSLALLGAGLLSLSVGRTRRAVAMSPASR